MSIRDQLIAILDASPKGTIARICRESGLSRETLHSMRTNKTGVNTFTAERIAKALGYTFTLTPLEPKDGE